MANYAMFFASMKITATKLAATSILIATLCFGPSTCVADSHAYVALSGNIPGTVTTFNTSTSKFTSYIPIAAGAVAARRTPNGRELWVLTADVTTEPPASNGISIVNMQTGRAVDTIALSFEPSGIAFNSKGTLAYVIGTTPTFQHTYTNIAVISVPTRAEIVVTSPPDVNTLGQFPVALSSDNSTLYVAQYTSIAVLDAKTLAFITTIALPSKAGTNDFPMLASAGINLLVEYGGELSVIDTSKNAITNSLPTGIVDAIAVSPDGLTAYVSSLMSSGDNGMMSMMQSLAIPSLQVIESKTYPLIPGAISVSGDGTKLATASFPMAVIDAATLSITNQVYPIDSPAAVEFGPANDQVYVAFSLPSAVSIVDQASGKPVAQLEVGSGATGVGTNAERNLVFVATSVGVTVIDPSRQEVLGTTQVFDIYPTSNTVVAIGEEMYVLVVDSVAIRNLATGVMSFLNRPYVPAGDMLVLNAIAASPNNRSLYVTFGAEPPIDGTALSGAGQYPVGLAIYDTVTNALLDQANVPGATEIVFSPDSSKAYIAGQVGSQPGIYVFDNLFKKVATSWTVRQAFVLGSICISPDGSIIYALVLEANQQSSVQMIDAATGESLQSYALPSPYNPAKMAISPDGTTLFLTGSSTGPSYNGESVLVMDVMTGSTNAVAYSAGTNGVVVAE